MTLIRRWARRGNDGRVRGANRARPISAGSAMGESGSAAAAAARRAYVTEVRQLVDEQSEILFSMVTAAAARASIGDRRIEVVRAARSLSASAGTRAVVFRIEAITDQPEDGRLADAFMMGQARCSLPTPNGTSDAWVLLLQRVGAGDAVSRHAWMHAGAKELVSEAMVTTTLESFFS